MLDGSSPDLVTHYLKIDFICEGRKSSQRFLICPIGRHKAILGKPWLSEENPQINWRTGIISYETAQFADEQEANDHPIPKEYLEFAKVFGEEEFNKLPPHRPYDIDIELKEDAKLGHAPLYSMTPAESKELKEWLDKELAQGKITPSKSPIASPVMFVKKKDGSLRLVVDYRKLNEATKKNSYPLPRQDDLLAKIQGAQIFTKLDLRWGYNNVRVKEGDEWKTAFRTKYGLFETKVMPFGLTNAPAAFQHFMNDILRDLLDVTVIVYLDDILIFSKNPEEHTAHVKEVLRRLQENQLFCKASKCFFNMTTVEYLGIMISPEGISIEKGKVEAIQSWPTPKTRKQVQSFLGFANFLRRFVPDFSKMSRPLNDLIPKDKTWQWGEKEEKGFMDIKRALCEAPVLRHPDPEKPYFLETDASGVAMGAVLSQRQEDGRLHPVAYMSKSFQGAAHNYDTHDKELLAIIEALQHWRIFLEGTTTPITIFTDHRNLEIHYRPGKQSGKPDALSRRSDHGDVPPEPQTMLPMEVFANLGEIPEESSLEDVIRDQIDKDESLSEILAFLERNGPAPPSVAKQFRDYSLQDGFLMYQGKVLIPDHEPLKNDLLQLHHDAPHAGHPGEQRTLKLVSRKYYWPGMRARILDYVRSCETCQRNRLPKKGIIPRKPLEVPNHRWEHISYDMITGFPISYGFDAILVIIDSFSKYARFIPCKKTLSAKGFAELFLRNWWKDFGLPLKTVSDRGTVFNNKFLRALYNRLNIKPHFSSAYHPESDGQTERLNQFIEYFLRCYCDIEQLEWSNWLPLAEFAYNNARHSTTGKTPFEALYGSNPNSSISNLRSDVPEADLLAENVTKQEDEIAAALKLSKEAMNKNKPEDVRDQFKKGDKVWLDGRNLKIKGANKLTNKRFGPFEIEEKLSDWAYRLKLPETLKVHPVFYVGLLSKSHENAERPFEERPDPETVEGEEEYEVEAIVDHKREKGTWWYRVKWKGYGPESNTWEPRDHLTHAKEILKKYHSKLLQRAHEIGKALDSAKDLRRGAVS
ncbi:Transposon Tf2-11 polyprotein [Rhizoctonia solani]|uniref:Transposon Tf2-11 polyprotein n=1 Tax=Rhizoctonia solani TaxID=456999 RepID=A0A0K6FWW9_9AGAM|nr:Transposon Tf2-11 polyprotein [Rhizoctonia solani]